jgi:hypothetical protein
MAITKKREIDKIEIVGSFKNIQIRYVTIIKEDGKEISRSFDRGNGVLHCLTDISDQPQEIKAVANVLWTPEVKAAFRAKFSGK